MSAAELAGLTRRQLEVIGNALADAAAYREERGGAECAACEAHPAALCDDHTEDVARATDYRMLARELGTQS